ncbi:MAG: baseplate assembly protein [Acidobacteria bacterium 13_1_20CM_3_53_8]|nr:MAG: baseplate assembly protein [Acidobacteria bacterium 13_1_20CM_3_53_8]
MEKRVPPILIGWPLLPVPDSKGQLNYPLLEESVRQSIRVILQTRPGEQLMRPRFGAGLEDFVYEQNTLTTRRRITDLIKQSLERWERRIILNRVEVNEVPGEPTHLRVEIAYQLKRTGASQQIGLTMELEA